MAIRDKTKTAMLKALDEVQSFLRENSSEFGDGSQLKKRQIKVQVDKLASVVEVREPISIVVIRE